MEGFRRLFARDLSVFVNNVAEVRMLQRLSSRDPFLRVVCQQQTQKVLQLCRKLQVLYSVPCWYHVVLLYSRKKGQTNDEYGLPDITC